MKKFKVVLLTFLLGVAMVLSACGGGGDDKGKEAGEGKDDGGTVVLNFWGGVPAENGPQAVVERWNKEHPDIQVKYTRYVNDDEGNLRVNTALQTGEDIDILMSHSTNNYEQRVDSDFLLDLSDRFDDKFVQDKIGPGALKWKVDGKYYALPTNINAIFLMFNEDALKKAGLDVPQTMTWDELRDYANKLKDAGFKYPYAIDADTIHGIIQNALIDVGFETDDGKSNLDHPNVRKGLQLYYDMMHKDQTMPKLAEQVSTNMAPEQMFLNGEIGFYQAGAWRLRLSNDLNEYPRDFKIAFAPYPHFEGQSIPAHHIEDAMSIVKDSKHHDEAWQFIEWYAKEGMMELAPGGRVPASKDAPQEEARQLIIKGAEDTYNVESLNSTYEVENTAMLREPSYQVLDNIKQEIERFFIGDQDLDTTINNMVEFHNNFLARNKK